MSCETGDKLFKDIRPVRFGLRVFQPIKQIFFSFNLLIVFHHLANHPLGDSQSFSAPSDAGKNGQPINLSREIRVL